LEAQNLKQLAPHLDFALNDFDCDGGNPIISNTNVYEPKERLSTTQRKDGKMVCCGSFRGMGLPDIALCHQQKPLFLPTKRPKPVSF
jgi:hypothetical protein